MKGLLSCKTLVGIVRSSFSKIKEDGLRVRSLSLVDCLMSGYAVFGLKYPSLLQFDESYREKTTRHNLRQVYGIEKAPSDTQMRERLDEVFPGTLRTTFKKLFSQCQRSKHLELFQYLEGRYLMPLDGTGYFYSKEVHCEQCCQKHHRDGSTSYYHQMLAGCIVHPDQKVVLPFAPEPILKQDGSNKNDSERSASKRFLDDLKREHPHLRVIITGDGLFSNGPFIKRLKADKHRFILVAKEKDHKFLFEEFNASEGFVHEEMRGKSTHSFKWKNDLILNDSHWDCRVNVLEYVEKHINGKKLRWVWVTDLPLNKDSVYQVMRGGRARHKIENETFNTLKNQGYQFGHNFGHGKNHLSTVFAQLMLLAFFVDQLQQLGCKMFTKAMERLHSKKRLWESQRSLFVEFFINSVEDLWASLGYGHQSSPLTPNTS